MASSQPRSSNSSVATTKLEFEDDEPHPSPPRPRRGKNSYADDEDEEKYGPPPPPSPPSPITTGGLRSLLREFESEDARAMADARIERGALACQLHRFVNLLAGELRVADGGDILTDYSDLDTPGADIDALVLRRLHRGRFVVSRALFTLQIGACLGRGRVNMRRILASHEWTIRFLRLLRDDFTPADVAWFATAATTAAVEPPPQPFVCPPPRRATLVPLDVMVREAIGRRGGGTGLNHTEVRALVDQALLDLGGTTAVTAADIEKRIVHKQHALLQFATLVSLEYDVRFRSGHRWRQARREAFLCARDRSLAWLRRFLATPGGCACVA
jgi:hypothetical protein